MQKEKEHAKAKNAALKVRIAEVTAASMVEKETKGARAENRNRNKENGRFDVAFIRAGTDRID